MKSIYLIFIVLASILHGQYCRVNTSDIYQFDVDSNHNKDYSSLKEILKDERIIMLGEKGHYDGSSISEIVKLIKYLNKELGYKNVLIELPFSITYVNEVTSENKSEYFHTMAGTMEEGFLGDPYKEFLDWGYENDSVSILGIDIGYTKRILKFQEDTLLALQCFGENNYLSSYFNILKSRTYLYSNIHRIELNRIWNIMAPILDSCLADSSYLMLKKSIGANIDYANLLCSYLGKSKKHGSGYYNVRDSLMASNVFFFDSIFNHPKIIVWAAAFHIAQNPIPFEGNKDIPMGYYIKRKLGDDVYSFPFIFYKGRSGLISRDQGESYKRREFLHRRSSPLGSIERCLHQKKLNFALVHFSKEYTVKTNPTYDKFFKLNWSKYYDGLFFINDMSPLLGGYFF